MAFFFFNKKGTSLVELIAVIVIMGIIAGIAVPVTIAVINRQKKNAAAKSAEAVVATIKQLTNELIAKASKSITIELAYASEGNTPSTVTVQIDGKDDTTKYAVSEFAVENLKAQGTISSTYDTTKAEYKFTTDVKQFAVNGYTITVANDGSATAGDKLKTE